MAFLDEVQVRQCHAAGVRVLPWTANEPDEWQRLIGWGVDGITTDYPDRLAEMLRESSKGVLESFLVPFVQAQEGRWSLCYGVQRFWKSIEAEVDRTHHQGFTFGGHLVTIGMRDLGDQAMSATVEADDRREDCDAAFPRRKPLRSRKAPGPRTAP